MAYTESNFRSIRVASVKSSHRKIWEKKASRNYSFSLKETGDKQKDQQI